MTRRVLAVRPDVSLEALTGLFLDRDIGGAPVVDDGGRPIGVVSKTDLLRVQRDSGDTREAVASGRQPSRGQLRVELGPGFHAEALPRVVAEAMTRAAYTISENAPLTHAAALMAFEGVHRVPVVSEDGRVAGMVTAIDILRWLAQQDGYLVPAGAGLEAHELSGLPATLAGVDSPRRPGPARSRPRRSR
jgi:CBS domain-containing protein